jgi:hypothetical protein
MALDKTALESLRLERDPGAGKYRQRAGSRRRLWYVLAAVAVVAAVLAWRAFSSAVPVQTVTIESPTSASGAVLNASGYVVARRGQTVGGRVVEAVKEMGLKVPLVVRLEGTNVDIGKKILAESGLPIISANNMADAAEKVVKAAKGA